jgi:hypothetical protein
MVLMVVLTRLIENVISDQLRHAVLQELDAIGRSGTIPDFGQPLTAFVLRCEAAAAASIKMGELDPYLREALMSEVLGALRGVPREERTAGRLLGPLMQSLSQKPPKSSQ